MKSLKHPLTLLSNSLKLVRFTQFKQKIPYAALVALVALTSLSILTATPSQSLAQSDMASNGRLLSTKEIFKRCYIRMTRLVPSETHPLLQAVVAGRLTPEAACVQLFDSAMLSADGALANRTVTNIEGRRILKTFNDLHISWFQAKTEAIPASGMDWLVRDVDEPALYFTRAAFLQGARFDSVVLLGNGLRGIRTPESPSLINKFDAQRIYRYYNSNLANEKNLLISYFETLYDPAKPFGQQFVPSAAVKAVTAPTAEIVDTGRLIGVKPALEIHFTSFLPIPTQGFTVPEVAAIGGSIANMAYNAHFGGGVIGSQSFMLHNTNLEPGQMPDSYTLINRRLTSRVFQDLLCHQLPTLTVEDVATEVMPTSTYAFQQQSTCMQCHSSIDGMAMTFKNFVNQVSSGAETTQTVGAPMISFVKLPIVLGSARTVLQSAQEGPRGRLHFRELLNGQPVSVNVSTLQQIGEQLASHRDLYLCAAKRYYKFFTGVDVNLSRLATTGTLDRFHQDQVARLGDSLKLSQSVRTLLGEIFRSDAFKRSNYLSEKVK